MRGSARPGSRSCTLTPTYRQRLHPLYLSHVPSHGTLRSVGSACGLAWSAHRRRGQHARARGFVHHTQTRTFSVRLKSGDRAHHVQPTEGLLLRATTGTLLRSRGCSLLRARRGGAASECQVELGLKTPLVDLSDPHLPTATPSDLTRPSQTCSSAARPRPDTPSSHPTGPRNFQQPRRLQASARPLAARRLPPALSSAAAASSHERPVSLRAVEPQDAHRLRLGPTRQHHGAGRARRLCRVRCVLAVVPGSQLAPSELPPKLTLVCSRPTPSRRHR